MALDSLQPLLPLLELREVTKRFAYRAGPWRAQAGTVTAVDQVSLAVQPREMVGLVGESGCGKTTLAKLIAQLEPVTEGSIRYDGRALTNGHRLPQAVRREIQLVFQDPTGSLDPRQRIGSAIAEPLIVHKLAASASAATADVHRLLEQVGLPSRYDRRYPRELSGGERQRVAIARALAVEPRVLILDEPVASLDVYIGAQILALLKRLHEERGLTCLLISHDLRVVGSMCHRVAVMYLGRVVEVAETAQLFAHPLHPYAELLLESAGLRSVGVEDCGELPSPLHPPSGCAFHTRCPLVEPRCRTTLPPLSQRPDGRRIACHVRS